MTHIQIFACCIVVTGRQDERLLRGFFQDEIHLQAFIARHGQKHSQGQTNGKQV